MIFRLIYMNGLQKGERVTISREPMTIGRDASCAISVGDDFEVAGEHCTIVHTENDELTIHDTGSMNKTLINSHEITDAKLKHGDMIEIGRTRFLVQAFVQADVKGVATQPSRKRKSLLLPLFIAAIFAVAAIAALSAYMDTHKRTDEAAAKKEVIPPSIFKDIKATASQPEPLTSSNAPAPLQPKQPLPPPAPLTSSNAPAPTQPRQPPPPPDTEIKAPPTPPPEKLEPKPDMPPPIVIASLTQQKFPQKPEYDEMRVASLTLRSTGSVIEDTKVAILFEFFDRDLSTGEITPARAIVPTKALSTQGLASTGEETVTAVYTVPKGLRSAISAESGRAFYGLRVKVMYAGDLVAQRAIPKTLLDED